MNAVGFRADYEVMQQNHIQGQKAGMESRVYSSLGSSYTDFKSGPVLRTGRDLDVAIMNQGMFAVQSKNGQEGYTRAGNFNISTDGFLTTASGDMVIGISGTIHIPPTQRVQIGEDGTISILPVGQTDMITVGRLKLVNPDVKKLQKGVDGLFYGKSNGKLEADDTIKVSSGSLEGSNVNPVETLVKLIDLSRHYEIHSNFIKNLAEQASEANKLLDLKA
jgi:flagellar basal-body rod protein FlgF